MKKTHSKDAKLPAFSAGVSELAALIRQLAETLRGESIRVRISIDLGEQSLSFDSLPEFLEQENQLPDKFSEFTVSCDSGFGSDSQRVSLNVYSIMAVGRAVSEDPIWAAGAIDAVRQFARQNRRWYSPIRSVPIQVLFFLLPMNLLGVMVGLALMRMSLSLLTWFALSLSALALAFIAFRFNRLFPACTIIVREDEGFLKRNTAEIAIVSAIISAIASLVAILRGS